MTTIELLEQRLHLHEEACKKKDERIENYMDRISNRLFVMMLGVIGQLVTLVIFLLKEVLEK